jgi:hypothetical protein
MMMEQSRAAHLLGSRTCIYSSAKHVLSNQPLQAGVVPFITSPVLVIIQPHAIKKTLGGVVLFGSAEMILMPFLSRDIQQQHPHGWPEGRTDLFDNNC